MIDFFQKKYLTSIWNSIWQDWVFGIWGQIQILWKYLVFEVKYKYLKVFGIPNKLKVFDPPLLETDLKVFVWLENGILRVSLPALVKFKVEPEPE